MSDDHIRFAHDIRTAQESERPWRAWLLLIIITALFAAVIGWALTARLEEVTNGEGEVVPAQQIQIVQSLEGGIISQLAVRRGDLVDEGQIVARLDDTETRSKMGELEQRRLSSLARIARLTAEAEDDDAPQFSDELQSAAAASVAAEQALFTARRAEQAQQVSVIEPQLAQRRQELIELEARREKITASLELLDRELELTRDLRKRGAVPEIELLQLERRAVDERGELAVLAASRERVAAAVEEFEGRLAAIATEFRASARSELASETAQLSVIEEAVAGARERVVRTTIRAPVRGVVNSVAITTIGGVLKPGDTVMEIVPLDDRLLIEARIRPQDVAFIHPGQVANVKLTAYDYALYGGLEGKVTQISPNTITDEAGNTYYRVIIETDETGLTFNGEDLPIIPGMLASIDILTGDKTVMEYLIKPFNKVRFEALRER